MSKILIAVIILGGAPSYLRIVHCNAPGTAGMTQAEAREEAAVVDCSNAIDEKSRTMQLTHTLKEWRSNNTPTSGIIAKTLYHCMTKFRRSPIKLQLTEREAVQILHSFSQ